ncbi:hypothetical protein AVV27_gp54 [Achromobacter phage 83-24]|uniref:Uncharacterized protein n=1 Tax=Achromobacter phage 83-24 TaxID=1589747 RepID=A0A0B4ZZM0_9CAUD|nr:hypothetical protein AVV27_gp54 [Achromobacter phage 83-24]AJD82887.1 hypothetical protein JWAP_00055 [Achromobacter phage 83-24]
MSKHSKWGKDPRTVKELQDLVALNIDRAGAIWTVCEENDMTRGWKHGLSIGSLALIHGRSTGAILARLKNLNLVDKLQYEERSIFPDFTIEVCGSHSAINDVIQRSPLSTVEFMTPDSIRLKLNDKWKWPQASAYMGYKPYATVSGENCGISPLEFYYPQALSLSAQQTYMRQGKMEHSGYIPTFNVSIARKWVENRDLERAKELAGDASQLDACYTIKTRVESLQGLEWPALIYRDAEGNITATEQVDKPIDRSKKTKDVMVYIGSNVRQYDSGGNLRVAMGDLDHAFDASFAQAMLKDEAFLKAAKNAGFHIEAQAVKSSQCVDKHADTQISQEQEMQEKIQNAINLLEEGVVYPVCRFMTDGVLSGKQYTYKHRGDLEVNDVAVVITPAGHPALVVVEDFAHVTDLQKGIKYKWLAQVFDRSNYDALVAREDEARENLRKSITEKSRQEQLAALLGDLGESDEVKTARNMLSSKSNEQVIAEHIEGLAQKSRERMAKMVKEHPELKEVMEKIAGAFGHIPGMPPLFDDADPKN